MQFKLRKSLLSLSLAGVMILLDTGQVLASTYTSVAKFISINNYDGSSTYKLKKEDLEDFKSSISFSSDEVDSTLGDEYKNIQGYTEKESWLLENNILSSDSLFNIDFDSLTTSQSDIHSSPRKSNFIMALYKAFFGVLNSKQVLVRTRCKDVQILDSNNIYDYSEGAYFHYVSPNVYEKYFTAMLDKGFIDITEFKDLEFIKQYKNLSTNKPQWFADDKFTFTSNVDKPLGASFTFQGTPQISTSLDFHQPEYFMQENIDTIDALRLIEKVLRVQEKDMTETEAKIVNFKYGVKYLSKLDQSTKSTVQYLVAMGILDFEDETEFTKIYSPLEENFMVTLLYRCANKAGRKDFSTVQLTDSDNYWLQQGLSEYEVEVESGATSDISYTLQNPDTLEQYDNSFFKRRRNLYNDGPTQFKVTLRFENPSQYTYNGTPIKDLKKGKPEEVTKTEDSNKTVEFTIKAPSQVTALAIVQTKISRVNEGHLSNQKISTIAKVSADGKDVYNFISKTALSTLKDENGNYIIPLEDKYLYNSATQTYAVLLDDDKRAIIGNEILDTSEVMVKGIEGEVFYNLDIIIGLMTNSYLDSLWGNKVISAYNGYNEDCKFQGVQDIRHYQTKDSSDYTTLDKGLLAQFNDKTYISLQHSQRVLNVLYKDIQSQADLDSPTYMVVEWRYVYPQWVNQGGNWVHQNSLNDTDMSSLVNLESIPSVKQMLNFLNTCPEDKELAKWWNSNVGLSNALCNYLFNSTGVTYCSNGWVAPSVTILSEEDLSEEDLDKIMDSLPFQGKYTQDFVPSDHPRISLFGAGSGTYGSLAQARHFASLKGSSDGHDFFCDFGDYVLTKTHTIYRSIGEKGLDKSMEVVQDGDVYYTKMVTQKQVITGALEVGKTYKIDDDEWYCQATRDLGNGSLCMEVVKKEPLVAIAEQTESGCNITLDESEEKYSSWWDSKRSALGVDAVQGNATILSTSLAFGVRGSPDLDDDSLVLVHGKDLKDNINKSSDADETLSNVSTTIPQVVTIKDKGASSTEDLTSKTKVHIYPKLLLYRYRISVDPSNNEIRNIPIEPGTCRENIMQVGISSAIIDSIANKHYGAVTQSDIPDNARVTIGDLTFISKYGKLFSTPIHNASLIEQLAVSGVSNQTLNSIFSKALGANLEIVHATRGIVKSAGLVEYVTKTGDSYNWDLCPTPITPADDDKVLTKVNGGYRIATKDKAEVYKTGDFYNSFCFSVQFDKNIKFKPLTQNGSAYSLVYCTDSGSNGYLDDIPWFTGSLSYSWDDELYGKLGTNNYKEASEFEKLMDDILAMYNMNFKKTIKGYLCYVTLMLLTFAIIMNLFVPIIKRIPVFMYIVDKVKHPNRGGDIGIDLIKILTLGLSSYDTLETPSHSLGVAGILSLILIAFVKIVCKDVLV